SVLDVPAAKIGIVVLDASSHVVQAQAVLLKHRGIDNDLKLFYLAAPCVDFTYSRNCAQLTLDHQFLQVLEFHGTHRTRKGVLIQFAESRRRRPKYWLDALGQL